MPRTSLVLSGIALVSVAFVAEGQSMTPLRLGAAVGTSFKRNTWSPQGGHATLSITSQSPGARLGFRVEVLFDGGHRLVPPGVGFGPSWESHRTIAFTINPTYRLWGRQTGLYVIAGLGIYNSWSESRPLFDGTPHFASVFEPGANMGLGFDFKAFGREVFVESRLHSGAFHDRVPLTLGIKFE